MILKCYSETKITLKNHTNVQLVGNFILYLKETIFGILIGPFLVALVASDPYNRLCFRLFPLFKN